MREESVQFLKRLVKTPSPSGFEQPVQALVKEEMRKFADEVKTDVHGNVIGIKNPQGEPRLMFAGHCDEVGFIVKYIDKNGFIFFSSIGGIDEHLIPGKRVYIHTKNGPLLGAVGKKPIHVMEKEEKKKVVRIFDQWIDIGAKDKKEAESLVSVGDPITFSGEMEELPGKLFVSRGFDDKVGAFVICEVLRYIADKSPRAAIFATSTVQEEIGLRGAQTAAYGINPKVGIAIDVGIATDFPTMDRRREGEIFLGKGVMLYKGANINPHLGDMLVKIAQEEKIPYQLLGEGRGTPTDANVIQLTRAGVAAGLVSVPTRYLHSPVEVLSLGDIENTIKLLGIFALKINEKTDFIP
ncbi:MAG: M42 family metallopeptidase [Candidatus Aerophobetes bacterium]|nr:M42 family metallopeptidase [Candidatus Aerophobetes bacterium]